MSAVKHQKGDTIDFVAGADHISGDILAVGDIKGVVVRDVVEDELGALAIEGVYRVESAVTTVGAKVALRVTEQDAVAAGAGTEYDGVVVGVYETGVSLVKLERGSVPA